MPPMTEGRGGVISVYDDKPWLSLYAERGLRLLYMQYVAGGTLSRR